VAHRKTLDLGFNITGMEGTYLLTNENPQRSMECKNKRNRDLMHFIFITVAEQIQKKEKSFFRIYLDFLMCMDIG